MPTKRATYSLTEHHVNLLKGLAERASLTQSDYLRRLIEAADEEERGAVAARISQRQGSD